MLIKTLSFGVMIAENYNQPKIRKCFVKRGGIDYNDLNQYSHYIFRRNIIFLAIQCNRIDIIHKILSLKSLTHEGYLVNAIFIHVIAKGDLDLMKLVIGYKPDEMAYAMAYVISRKRIHSIQFLLNHHDIDVTIPKSKFCRGQNVGTFRQYYINIAGSYNFIEAVEMFINWNNNSAESSNLANSSN